MDEAELDLAQIERHLKVLEQSQPTSRPAPYDARRAELERAAFPRFVAWLGPRGLPSGPDVLQRLERDARVVVEELAQGRDPAPSAEDQAWVARRIACEVLGTGPLQDLLDDPEVNEIMVNGASDVRVERAGRMERSDVRFRDDAHLLQLIHKIAERLHRRIDFQQPTMDGRLPDGSRIHAVIPPIALGGPVLTIRKFGAAYRQLEDLIEAGSLTPEMAYYLGACVKARLNIAIAGGSSTGKTTTLNILAGQASPQERLVTIEELAELDFSRSHNHVIRLQARGANVEGKGAQTVRMLVREALRMRADRIVVGEARGPEMLDVIQAMRCGHDGSMTTIHASGPEDLIERAVTLCLFGSVGLGEASLRRMVCDALDVIVVLGRFADGSRKVLQITEPYRDPRGLLCSNQVFSFDLEGYRDSVPQGAFRARGPSRHLDRFGRMDIDLPAAAGGRPS